MNWEELEYDLYPDKFQEDIKILKKEKTNLSYYRLGIIYMTGDWVEQDMRKALKYFGKMRMDYACKDVYLKSAEYSIRILFQIGETTKAIDTYREKLPRRPLHWVYTYKLHKKLYPDEDYYTTVTDLYPKDSYQYTYWKIYGVEPEEFMPIILRSTRPIKKITHYNIFWQGKKSIPWSRDIHRWFPFYVTNYMDPLHDVNQRVMLILALYKLKKLFPKFIAYEIIKFYCCSMKSIIKTKYQYNQYLKLDSNPKFFW